MNKHKWATVLTVVTVFIVPFSLAYYWMSKPRPTVDKLMIAGNRTLVDKIDSLTGKTFKDTLYHRISEFKFISHLGDTVTNKVLNDKVLITDFFFTECPTICIDMSKNMALIQQVFVAEPHVTLLSHTVDPERDSVAKLYEYAERYDVNPSKWLLLTGEKKELYDMARNSYLISAAIPGDGGPHDFIHDQHLILVDKEGRVRGFYDGTNDEEIQRCIMDTKKLLVSYVIMPPKNRKKKKE